MGFITRGLKAILCLVIFHIVMSMLYANGIQIFNDIYYTEIGFVVFVTALFLDTSFSFQGV